MKCRKREPKAAYILLLAMFCSGCNTGVDEGDRIIDLLPVADIQKIIGDDQIVAEPGKPLTNGSDCYYHSTGKTSVHVVVFEDSAKLFPNFQLDDHYSSYEGLGDNGLAGAGSVVFTRDADLFEVKVAMSLEEHSDLASPEQLLQIAKLLDQRLESREK
jgi:hypothetical protein